MASHKILLVEDNPDDVELALHACRRNRLSAEVVVARDGEEALEYLFAIGRYAGREQGDLPAVMVLDLKLPGMDGLEVLRSIRQRPETRRLPVVILTSSDEERDRLKSYQEGANSFVHKPLDFTEFAEAVARLGVYWLATNVPPKGCVSWKRP